MNNHELLCELLHLKLKDLNRTRYVHKRSHKGNPDIYEVTRGYPEDKLPEAQILIEDHHLDEICTVLIESWCPHLGVDLNKFESGSITIEVDQESISVEISTGDIWMRK